MIARRRSLATYLSVMIAGSVIAVLTISPSVSGPVSLGMFCVVCGSRGLADLILNFLLFVPLGASLLRLGWSTRRVLIACVLVSAFIEFIQLALPGRTPSVRDVVANGLGGWLGALLFLHAASLSTSGIRARNSFIAFVLYAIGTVAATGWLFSVAPRGEKPLYGQWDPQFANMAHWGGKVRSVLHQGEPLPSQRMPATPSAMTAEPIGGPIKIDIATGPAPSSLAPIVGIADSEGDHLILLGQDGEDIILRVRRQSALLRLNSPDVRFANALATTAPGDSVSLEVYGIEGLSPCLVWNGQGTCSPKPAAGRAWALFLYRSHWPRLAVSALDALMFLLLALPVGFLSRAVPRRLAIAGVVSLAIGVPVAASLSGLAIPSFIEVLGLGMGLTLGAFLAHARQPHESRSGTPDHRRDVSDRPERKFR